MSSWLRSLHGHITELATEVLNEATEEVQDPESELQVAKKKLSEAEKQLEIQHESLERSVMKISHLEDDLYAKNLEVESLKEKYDNMIKDRDNQLQTLRVELERLRHSAEHHDSFNDLNDDEEDDDDGDDDFFPDKRTKIARLKDEIEQLKKEIAHWKRVVDECSKQNLNEKVVKANYLNSKFLVKIAELEREIVRQKIKHSTEIAALIAQQKEEPKFEPSDWSIYATDEDIQSSKVSVLDQSSQVSIDVELNVEETADEVDVIKKHMILLQEEHEKLGTVNAKYKMQMEQQSMELDELRMEIERLNRALEEQSERHQREINEEKERTRVLMSITEEECERGQQLEDQEKEKKHLDDIKSMDETIAVLKDEIVTLQKRCEIAETVFNEQQTAKQIELDKLKLENRELTAAYNDLNEEFENHKAEHGSVVVSNRDLTARIDALKANLIEYEERYEVCRNENAETVQQLEKLSQDFKRLRSSFENSKTKMSSVDADEVERLRMELNSSKDDRDKLRADVERFRAAIGTIDQDLNSLRESNERLVKDNKVLGATLDRFTEIREMLENSDSELKTLREKFTALQQDYKRKEDEWRKEVEKLSEARDDAKRQLQECQRESALFMNQSTLEIAEGTKTSSSEETTDSNGGWEKMADWDATTAANGSNNSHGNTSVLDELREALAAVTEKTEECEELRKQKNEADKESEMRQSCIDELMTQLSILQEQHRAQAETSAHLQQLSDQKRRENLELERRLIRVENELEETKIKFDMSRTEIENLKIREKNSIEEHTQEINRLKQEYDGKFQVAFTQANGNVQKEKEELEEKLRLATERNKEMGTKLESVQCEIEQLQFTLQKQNEIIEQVNKVEDDELLALKENLKAEQEKYLSLHQANSTLQQMLSEAQNELAKNETIRTELIAALEQKHNESVGYHSQLQAMIAEREQLNTYYQERLKALEQELKSFTDSRDKALKECERLRNHLLEVEETSTREAVSAEERETALRETIKRLQERTEKSVDTVIESAHAYEKQIGELSEELLMMKAEKVSAVERVHDLEKKLTDNETTLSNLQKILRDIVADHETQVAQFKEEIGEYKNYIEAMELEILQMKEREKSLLHIKETLENSTLQLKEELTKKDSVIDELEANLSDRMQSAEDSQPSSSNKIDDQVLRQLFLSYFTAEKDKQPEIALLLASVLGYPKEDMNKINAANQYGSRGWFSSGGGQKFKGPNISLAEQFIRFLENESIASSKTHSLPVQQPPDIETMRSSSIPLQPSTSSSSSTDLRSIINE